MFLIFFRLADMDSWDHFEILTTPILQGMRKPECICSYGGSLDVENASSIQEIIPFALIRPETFEISSAAGKGNGGTGASSSGRMGSTGH